MKPLLIFIVICFVGINHCYPQSADTVKSGGKVVAQHYFIISAGTGDQCLFQLYKPLSVETIAEFDEYVQRNAKTLKDARVIVTGKPKKTELLMKC